MENNNKITVNVFDLKTGLTTYNDVEYIRLTDDKYNLLIMVDYTPIIGSINGNVDVMYKGSELHFHDIKASYMNSNNVFNLMIQGDKEK